MEYPREKGVKVSFVHCISLMLLPVKKFSDAKKYGD